MLWTCQWESQAAPRLDSWAHVLEAKLSLAYPLEVPLVWLCLSLQVQKDLQFIQKLREKQAEMEAQHQQVSGLLEHACTGT